MRNASIILFCITDNFVNDSNCAEIFQYNKFILKKPYILITLGESMEWQKSQIGAIIAHELFIKINTQDRYKIRFPEMLEQISKKISLSERFKRKNNHTQCFISYCLC
jgi:hypothetical protein